MADVMNGVRTPRFIESEEPLMDDPNTLQIGYDPGRMDRLESVLDKLTTTQVQDRSRLSRIESLIETLGTAQGETQKELKTLAHAVNSSGKLNTSTIMAMIAAVGLILTIGGLWTAPTNQKIDDHIALDGHAPAMQIHAANSEKFVTIANQLKRSDENEARLRDRLDEKDDEIALVQGRLTAIESSRVDTNRIVPMERAIAKFEATDEVTKHNALMEVLTDIRDKVSSP